MKHSNHSIRAGKPNPAPQSQRQPAKAAIGKHWLPRLVLIFSCLVVACVGTWALCEFVIFNNLPPELVGKWVVEGGEQDGATFDFFRAGHVQGNLLNKNGRAVVLNGKVAVEDKRLLITTQHPITHQDETQSAIIRELTAMSLILEFQTGEVYRMSRAR